MRGENMAKNRPKCCQIAKIFVAMTSEKVYLAALEKPGKLRGGFFFLLLCGHPDEERMRSLGIFTGAGSELRVHFGAFMLSIR